MILKLAHTPRTARPLLGRNDPLPPMRTQTFD
jgi:hypothetical protein